ncbi:MAG: ABC transporter substrate-binding protein [Sporolactobacillus sp.]
MNHIKKSVMLCIGLLLLTSLLIGCSSTNKAAQKGKPELQTRVLKDAMGHKVKIPAHPKRVIASYMEDDLIALGIKPVAQWSINNGKGVQDYLQSDLKKVPTIPYDLPYESVATFKPDLMLIDSAASVTGNKYIQYNRIAPTYVIDNKVNSDWRTKFIKIGRVFGEKAKAEKILANYDKKAQSARTAIKKSAGTPKVAAIWLVGGKFFVVGENVSSGSVLYRDLKLKAPNVVQKISKQATANWSPISLESLAKLDADDIFLINSDKNNGASMLKEDTWKSIPAVKKHHVYSFNADSSWLYSGPIANQQMMDSVVKSLTK